MRCSILEYSVIRCLKSLIIPQAATGNVKGVDNILNNVCVGLTVSSLSDDASHIIVIVNSLT
jgi:hypothetical protein